MNTWLNAYKEINLKRNKDGTHNVIAKIDVKDNKDIKEIEVNFKAQMINFDLNILVGFDDNLTTTKEIINE